MANQERNVVSASTTAAKLPDGVIEFNTVKGGRYTVE